MNDALLFVPEEEDDRDEDLEDEDFEDEDEDFEDEDFEDEDYDEDEDEELGDEEEGVASGRSHSWQRPSLPSNPHVLSSIVGISGRLARGAPAG